MSSSNAEQTKFKGYMGDGKAGTKSLLIDCGKAQGPTAAIITISTSTKSLVNPYHPQFFPNSD
jgi:hypothetical protein